LAASGEERMGLEVEWVFNTSSVFPSLSFGAGFMGCFTVYDIDSDGLNEILFGTRRGDSKRLWCIEQGGPGRPKLEWIYPDISEDGLPDDPTSKPSLVDVDRDGVYEICLAGRGGRLHVLEPDGSLLWTWDNPEMGAAMHGAPQAFDVDGDGYVEFFLNDNSGFIHRVSHLGQLVWTSSQAGAGNQGHPTICDIDRDGEYEVLFASNDMNLYCLVASTGGEKWRFDTKANMETNQVIVLDVDGNGQYEAICWTSSGTPPSSGKVYVVSCFGEEISRWTNPQEGINIRLCQALGDVDEDGSMEMALMTGRNVFVIDVGGPVPVVEWELNFSLLSEQGVLPAGALTDSWSSYQLIADIDGDGEQEVLWLAPFPIVTDGATGAIEGYYVNDYIAVARRAENGGWWGDVDGDGVSEWLCDLNGPSHRESMVYCFTMNGRFPADAYWPEYYHCSLPGPDQAQADWLRLKAPYSNGLFFPISEIPCWLIGALFTIPGRFEKEIRERRGRRSKAPPAVVSRVVPPSTDDHFVPPHPHRDRGRIAD
jgi:outer membrane protein assembly factor BamB